MKKFCFYLIFLIYPKVNNTDVNETYYVVEYTLQYLKQNKFMILVLGAINGVKKIQ